ncbi:hypothetical protein [Lysobacter fragariae]
MNKLVFFVFGGGVALAVVVALIPVRSVAFGVPGHGKVLQILVDGPILGEAHVVLRTRNAHGRDEASELQLNCVVDAREEIFREVRALQVVEGGFNVTFNSPGFCYGRPPSKVEVGGMDVRLSFLSPNTQNPSNPRKVD